MTRREKILAGAVGVMGVLWFGSSALTSYRDSVDSNRARLREVEQQLSQARVAKLRGQRAVTRLRSWQQQSLPTNPDIAKSLYEDWLRNELTEAGLKVTSITNSSGLRAPNDRFQEFTFKVEAAGRLAQFTDFLARFYQAGFLQRISQASVAPAPTGDGLTITLSVDALSMRDAPHTDTLPTAASDVELADVDKLQSAITERNLFSPYKDPQVSVAASTPGADEANQAFITGMTLGAEGWQMSVRLKDSGRMLYFRAGDPISIGNFKAKVSEIDGRRAIVEQNGRQKQVFLGQNLSQAQPLTPQAG